MRPNKVYGSPTYESRCIDRVESIAASTPLLRSVTHNYTGSCVTKNLLLQRYQQLEVTYGADQLLLECCESCRRARIWPKGLQAPVCMPYFVILLPRSGVSLSRVGAAVNCRVLSYSSEQLRNRKRSRPRTGKCL